MMSVFQFIVKILDKIVVVVTMLYEPLRKLVESVNTTDNTKRVEFDKVKYADIVEEYSEEIAEEIEAVTSAIIELCEKVKENERIKQN